MKRLLKAAAALLFVAGLTASASTSNVAANVIDTDGQTWNDGTFTATLTIPGGGFNPDVPKIGGVPVSPVIIKGVLSDAGVLSGAFTDTSSLDQKNGVWIFTICPNTSGSNVCQIITTTIIGSTPNLNPVFSQMNAPRFSAGGTPYGYLDLEMQLPPPAGATYYNVTMKCVRQWNGRTWTGSCSGDVSEIIPGTNVTCTPNVGGGCVGAVTVNSSGGGSGSNPASPQGSAQFANFGATAFIAAPPLNTDAFNTSNNGATRAQALGCTSTVCDLYTPANSTDTEPSFALPTEAGNISSLWIDHRGNRVQTYVTNPQSSANFPDGSVQQSAAPGNLMYSESQTGPIQGSGQSNRNQISYYFSPGYALGLAGCPLACPGSGYTSAAEWQLIGEYDDADVFDTEGIHNFRNTVLDFGGIGDAQGPLGAGFVHYAGGCAEFSAECLHGIGSVHILTMGDTIGTVTSITDSAHLKINVTANNNTQGNGRFAIDFTNIPLDTHSNPLQSVNADLSVQPGPHAYPTVVFNDAAFPVSTAIGTLTNDCTVPIQQGTTATGQNSLVDGCAITVTSGTFTMGGGLVCMAAPRGNQFAIGIVPVSVTGLSGGRQTLVGKIHRSVPAGADVFQGGGCSWAMVLGGDINNGAQDRSQVTGSVYPIIGTLDAHTVAVMNYQASQAFGPVPNPGSQWVTRDTGNSYAAGGFTAANLTRVGGSVTATITSGAQAIPPRYQMLNGAKFFTISGCSESTMNSTGVNSLGALPGPAPNTFTYALAGPDNVCPTAVITMANTTVTFTWAAEVLDVRNTTPGLAPFAVVDGTLATTQQPNFQVGDTIDIPPHYAAASDGLRIVQELAQPQFGNTPLSIAMNQSSAYEGQAIAITATPFDPDNYFGVGGQGHPPDVIDTHGYYGNFLSMDTAPANGSSVLSIGFPSGLFPTSTTNSVFRRYNIIATDVAGGGNIRNTLVYDSDSDSYWWTFSFSATPAITFGPNQSQFIMPTSFVKPQYQVNVQGTYTSFTQMAECSPIFANGAVPPCYQSVIPTTATITHSGTAGTTEYSYILAVNDVTGLSFSGIYFTFTGNTTLNGTNFNNIPCIDLPAGKTGTIYNLSSPAFRPVGAVGNCSSSATIVHDTGSYGTAVGEVALNDGTQFLSGGFLATGETGYFAFSQPDVFGTSSPATTITASISQTAAGVLSVNTTTVGNGLGTINAGAANIAGSPVCTVATGCSAGTGITLTTTGSSGAATLTGTTLNIPIYTSSGSGVTSFNTRTGPVAPASSDYSFSLISGSLGNSQGPSGLTGILLDTAGVLSVATPGTAYVIPSGSITGNSGTTSAFASTPTLCSSGQVPNGILANGNATGCAGLTLANIAAGASPTGLFDFSAATQFKLPIHAGYTAAAAGEIGYDSTNGNAHTNYVGTDLIIAGFPSASLPTSGHCAQFTEIGAWWEITDAGAACGSGGSGISGGTAGFLPLFGSATTITANSHIDDSVTTASTVTVHEALAVNDGSGHGGGVNGTEGTAPTGASGVDNLWADSTAHRLMANNNNGGALPVAEIIAKGTATLGTTAIASATCATVVTVSASGVASTDAITWNPNGSLTAITGYIPSTSGGLTIADYPTSGNVNFDVCNWTAASITPGAVTLNWSVSR